jgi:hypothetical protein
MYLLTAALIIIIIIIITIIRNHIEEWFCVCFFGRFIFVAIAGGRVNDIKQQSLIIFSC